MTYRIEHRQFDGSWWVASSGHTLGEAWELADPYAGLSASEIERTTLLLQTRIVDEEGRVVMAWGTGEDNREQVQEAYDHLERFLGGLG